MLSFLRKRKRSWIITLLLSIIVLTFVLYFGGSYWSRSATDTVVEVNGESIKQRDLEIRFQRALEVYRDRFKGSLTQEMIKNLNIKATVLDELIQQRLLLQEAERLGLTASEDEIVKVVTSLPVFQVAGQFSKERYLEVLRYQRISPTQFEGELRDDITIRKLLELIRDSVHVSDSEVLARYRSEAENINLDFVRLPADEFLGAVKVTPEEVKSFYDKNREALKEPLRAQVEYIAYPFTHFAAQAQVSDKEAEEFYRAQREKRFQEPKAAKVRHILLRAPEEGDKNGRAATRQKAENILAEALKGKDFASLAKQYSEDSSGSAGGELGWVTPGQVLPQLEKAIFELKKGEISKVVETPLGYHILKVEDTKEEKTKQYTEVRDQIMAELKREKGRTEAGKAVDQDREKLISGADFSHLAGERGLRAIVSPPFARGESLPEVGNLDEFQDKAFSLPVKELTSVQGPEAYYLMRVTQRKEPFVPSLDSVRDRIEAVLKNKKASELALQKANGFLAQLRKEKDFAQFASQQGLKVEETGWFPRNASQIPKVGALQELRPGGIPVSQYQPLPDRVYTGGDAAYLLYLKGNKEADMESFEKDKDRLRAQTLAQKRDSTEQQFIDSLKARARIKFHSTDLEAS